MPSKRKCKQCSTRTSEFILVGLRAFCNYECATLWGVNNIPKGETIKRKLANPRKKNDETKIGYQRDLTQDAYNKLRRLQSIKFYTDQGLEPVCISCGLTARGKVGYFCCGHHKTRGGFPELAFDEINTELQCNKRCNSELSGNITGDKHTHGYVKGMVIKYGEEEAGRRMEYLERHHPPKKWKWFEFKEYRAEINKQIRELEDT